MTTHPKTAQPRPTKRVVSTSPHDGPRARTVDGIQVSQLVTTLPEPSLSLYPDRTPFTRTRLVDDDGASPVLMLQNVLTGQCLLKRRRPDVGTGRIQHKDLHVLLYVAYVTGQ